MMRRARARTRGEQRGEQTTHPTRSVLGLLARSQKEGSAWTASWRRSTHGFGLDSETGDATGDDERHQIGRRYGERLDLIARHDGKVAGEVVRHRKIDGDLTAHAERIEVVAR